jgi:predicted xylose isomerase-like sugar epimerase
MLAVAERRNRIPILLRGRGMTAYALAREIGMVPHNVKSIVDSPTIPDGTNYVTLRKIADALGVRIDELEIEED